MQLIVADLFHRDTGCKTDCAIGTNAVDATDPIPRRKYRRLIFGIEALLPPATGDWAPESGGCGLANGWKVLLAFEVPLAVCSPKCPTEGARVGEGAEGPGKGWKERV